MNQNSFPLATSTWDADEYQAISRVLGSPQLTMGNEVLAYEAAFGRYFGIKQAVMSNSGSSANLLALAAIKYSSMNPTSSRNEVIVPAVSWSTTYYPVSQNGFKLKFVDVDLETLNASPESISEAVDSKTAGILAVNLLGNPSRLQEIRDIADSNGLFMVEDNCESMGASVDGKFAGTFGDLGTFSSYFSHHISTIEGGMTVTNSLELAQIMHSLRSHGWTRGLPASNFVHAKTGNEFDDAFRFVLPGYNLRPLELEAAIGSVQLSKFNRFLEARRKNALTFGRIMSDFPQFSTQKEFGESSWFGFSLVLDKGMENRRSELVDILRSNGVECRPIVAGNFTRNPVLRHLPHCALPPLPNADQIHDGGLFVGNHHFGLENEFNLLADSLKEFARQL